MLKTLASTALLLALTAPSVGAQQLLFRDTFDTENGGAGATQTNYGAFANWNVTGQVDLVKSGDFGITCSGSCVDLDGSSGPGSLSTKLSYAFNAGDVLRYSILRSGAQRGRTAVDQLGFRLDFAESGWYDQVYVDIGNGFFDTGINSFTDKLLFLDGVPGTAPYYWISVQFRAQQAGVVRLGTSTTSADNFGPIIDEVKLERLSTAVPEPGTFALVSIGLLALGAVGRRRRA